MSGSGVKISRLSNEMVSATAGERIFMVKAKEVRIGSADLDLLALFGTFMAALDSYARALEVRSSLDAKGMAPADIMILVEEAIKTATEKALTQDK